MRISDWSSDVCSSDLSDLLVQLQRPFVWLTLETGDIGLLNTLSALADAYRVNGYDSIAVRLEEATGMATGQADGRIAQHVALELNTVNSIPILLLAPSEVADTYIRANLFERLRRHA